MEGKSRGNCGNGNSLFYGLQITIIKGAAERVQSHHRVKDSYTGPNDSVINEMGFSDATLMASYQMEGKSGYCNQIPPCND